MRSRYLFDLARICHIPAPLVDALRFMDFAQYCLEIDSYNKSVKEAQKAQAQAWGG